MARGLARFRCDLDPYTAGRRDKDPEERREVVSHDDLKPLLPDHPRVRDAERHPDGRGELPRPRVAARLGGPDDPPPPLPQYPSHLHLGDARPGCSRALGRQADRHVSRDDREALRSCPRRRRRTRSAHRRARARQDNVAAGTHARHGAVDRFPRPTSRRRRPRIYRGLRSERATGIEPTTSSLGSFVASVGSEVESADVGRDGCGLDACWRPLDALLESTHSCAVVPVRAGAVPATLANGAGGTAPAQRKVSALNRPGRGRS